MTFTLLLLAGLLAAAPAKTQDDGYRPIVIGSVLGTHQFWKGTKPLEDGGIVGTKCTDGSEEFNVGREDGRTNWYGCKDGKIFSIGIGEKCYFTGSDVTGRTTIQHCPKPPAPAKTQDDGFGKCPAFSHWHALVGIGNSHGGDAQPDPPVKLWSEGRWIEMDGLCHKDDNTDAPITERPKLPKPAPQFKPGKEPLV